MKTQTSEKQRTSNQPVGQDFNSNANPKNAAREEDLEPGQAEDTEEETDDTLEEEEDTDPALDENDLEENNLSDEEADNIEWDPNNKTDR